MLSKHLLGTTQTIHTIAGDSQVPVMNRKKLVMPQNPEGKLNIRAESPICIQE